MEIPIDIQSVTYIWIWQRSHQSIMQRKKKREFHVDRENPIQQTTEDAFSLTLETKSSISISYTLSQVLTVFSLIKINGTTIYTKNYLIKKRKHNRIFYFSWKRRRCNYWRSFLQRFRIFNCLNIGSVWALKALLDIIRTTFFWSRTIRFKVDG